MNQIQMSPLPLERRAVVIVANDHGGLLTCNTAVSYGRSPGIIMYPKSLPSCCVPYAAEVLKRIVCELVGVLAYLYRSGRVVYRVIKLKSA